MSNPYNGFTPRERDKTWQLQKWGREDGSILDWSHSACELCSLKDGLIMPHLENYFDYIHYLPLCVECHMNIHGRFKNPTGWQLYLAMLEQGYKPNAYQYVIAYFHSKAGNAFWRGNESYYNNQITSKPDNKIELPERYKNLHVIPIDLKQILISKGDYTAHFIDEMYAQYRKKQKLQLALIPA